MFRVKAVLGLIMAIILASPSLGHADERTDKLTSLVQQSWQLITQNKNEEAISLAEQALAITGDPAQPSPETAYVMKALSAAYTATGQFERAETYARRVVAIEAAVFGPDDVRDMEGLISLGVVYVRQGRLEEAGPYFEKTLSIAETKLPPDSPQLAFCLTTVGQFYLHTGKKAEGQALLTRADAINAKRR